MNDVRPGLEPPVPTFRAMGTEWALVGLPEASLRACIARITELDARLSRFRADSALTRLNRDRVATDPVLAAVTRRALQLRDATGGAFDPTLGATLRALGYDRSFTTLPADAPARPLPPTGTLEVTVDGDTVRLDGLGELDLGGIAKGWSVDDVAGLLRAAGVPHALVDGGGDLAAVGGPWPVGVREDDSVDLLDNAVATSSTLHRRWRCGGEARHHILDPRRGAPAAGPFDTVTVVAPDAATADALATALLADPDAALPALPTLRARVWLRSPDGAWWTPAAGTQERSC